MTRIQRANNITFSTNIEGLEEAVNAKKKEFDQYFENNGNDSNLVKLREEFKEYNRIHQELILARRLESGASTILYFIITISGSVIGLLLSILVFITTRGNVGHIILVISMLGSLATLVIAATSVKNEREFIRGLKNEIDSLKSSKKINSD